MYLYSSWMFVPELSVLNLNILDWSDHPYLFMAVMRRR